MSGHLPLLGVRVGILQTRYAHELASLVQRVGGVPLLAPCLREVRNDDADELLERVRAIIAAPPHVFVFQTGVGARALFDLARDNGLDEALARVARDSLVVARGPKPLTVLLELGLRADCRTAEPHTTEELLAVLGDIDLDGKRVAVQHYGQANTTLIEHLRGRADVVVELFSYRWALPDDVGPIVRFLDELRAGRVAVTAFTSASQVENLFTVAADNGLAADLPQWLNERTAAAAIGPTCARALEQHGVAIAIRPDRPKMVPFVRAISDHFSNR